MLQAYPGSDPVRDVLSGRISLRKFRVMVEHLPPDNALARARNGVWGDALALSYQIESRLRELITMYANAHRGKGDPAHEVEYLPRPRTPDEVALDEAQRAYDDLMQQQLEQTLKGGDRGR